MAAKAAPAKKNTPNTDLLWTETLEKGKKVAKEWETTYGSLRPPTKQSTEASTFYQGA